tara:strand:- start:8826 stop:10019 length:1194 start_codon:yes stop_codon:yes gene_type:complete
VKKLIFGYGITGRAIEKYFLQNNIDFLIYDDYLPSAKTNIDKIITEVDEMFISPGIPPRNSTLNKLIDNDIKISTDLDLFERINKSDAIKIGVTGTNGKTTFVKIVTEFLNKMGYSAISAGNIGNSPLELINKKYDYIIFELSSYQLHYLSDISLDYAIILNFASDHLDWHDSYKNYLSSKAKIFKFTKNENVLFYDEIFKKFSKKKMSKANNSLHLFSENKNLSFSQELVGSFLDLVYLLDLKIQNLEDVCKNYLLKTKQIEHRYEIVNFQGGVTFINDSKATNFHAVTNAIKRSSNITLILHGLTKNVPNEELIINDSVKKIIKPIDMKIKFKDFSGKVIHYESIRDIKTIILSEMEEGDTILFSCGGASFNDFKNYEERGNYFKNLVKEIENEI